MMKDDAGLARAHRMFPTMQGHFTTTRWSLVHAAGGAGKAARDALGELCRAYWYPLYAFARRRGVDPEEARDVTQGFFADLLERRSVARLDPELGRFRAFLIASFKHYIAHQRDRERAIKRRAGEPAFTVSLDAAEDAYRHEPRDLLDPAHLYERRWARVVLDRALARLRDDYAGAGKAVLFERLQGFLTGDADVPYRTVADALGTSEGAVKVAVHRMRTRLGALLRAEVAETVERPEDVDDELRHLLRVVSG